MEDFGFEIISWLGVNQTGGRVTYLAISAETGNKVVIKQFQFARIESNWDGYKAIKREISILRQIEHPNVPKYLDSFESYNGPCLVQEYIEATPLSSMNSLYTPAQVKHIIICLLKTLIYLQGNFMVPVYHRDIKPDNILVDIFYKPYLVDFGGAKVGDFQEGSTMVSGTLGFMTPEQRIGRVDRTTDLYGLGLSVICWLTGSKNLDNLVDFSTNQVIDLRKKLKTFGLPFIEWIETITQAKPGDRYPDAKTALNAFQTLDLKSSK